MTNCVIALLRCSDFGQRIDHLVVHLGHNLLDGAFAHLLRTDGREHLDCYAVAPIHHPSATYERRCAVEHYWQDGHLGIIREDECSGLEVVNLAILRACTLGEYGHRRTLRQPLLASVVH